VDGFLRDASYLVHDRDPLSRLGGMLNFYYREAA
jgi:hypothetical protein